MVVKAMLYGGVVCALFLLLPQGSLGAVEPECAKNCHNLPGVTHEVEKTITDDGQTCKLHPDFRQCIYAECLVSELPQAMLDYLKQEQDCDLSGASQRYASVVTMICALVLVLLLK